MLSSLWVIDLFCQHFFLGSFSITKKKRNSCLLYNFTAKLKWEVGSFWADDSISFMEQDAESNEDQPGSPNKADHRGNPRYI